MSERRSGDTKVSTRVALMGHEENFLSGYATFEELIEDGFWSVASLSMGGPRLGARAESICDMLAVTASSADPRIWPLKIAQVVGSHGNSMAGLAASTLSLDRGRVGPALVGRHMEWLRELARELSFSLDRQALGRWLDEMFARRKVCFGFGVPGRAQDERYPPIASWYEARGYPERYFWKLSCLLNEIFWEKRQRTPNLVQAMAPIYLDLGFEPEQGSLLTLLSVTASVYGNAYEGSRLQRAELKSLPTSVCEYQGPAPRRSSRFQQEDAARHRHTG